MDSVATYTLKIPVPNPLNLEGKNLLILEKKITSNARECPVVFLNIMDTLAGEIIGELGRSFRADFEFSLKSGARVNSDDEQVCAVASKHLKGSKAVFSQSFIDLLGLDHFKETDEKRVEVLKRAFHDEKFACVNWVTHKMIEGHLLNKEDLKSEDLKEKVARSTRFHLIVESSHTGALRFPHAYLKLWNLPSNQVQRVCVAGQELLPWFPAGSYCPSFIELYTLFPKANFLVLHTQKEDVDTQKEQYCIQESAFYDPSTLRFRTVKFKGCPHYIGSSLYQNMFGRIIKIFKEKVTHPSQEEANSILSGLGLLKPVTIKLGKDQVQVRHWTFTRSPFTSEEKGQFDLVFAPFALTDRESIFQWGALSDLLSLLKVGASLLIQTKGYPEKALKGFIGKNYTVQKIALPSFAQKAEGSQDEGTLVSGMYNHTINARATYQVETSAVYFITKKPEQKRKSK